MTPQWSLAGKWRGVKARFRTLTITGPIVILFSLIPDLKFWLDILRQAVQPISKFLGTGLGRVLVIISCLALIYFDQWRFTRNQLHAGTDSRDNPDPSSAPSWCDRLADEDSAGVAKRLVACGASAKLNVNTVEPYIDVTFRIVNASMFFADVGESRGRCLLLGIFWREMLSFADSHNC